MQTYTRAQVEEIIISMLIPFADVLTMQMHKIQMYHKLVDDLGLDSLDIVEFSMNVETTFSITVPDEEFEGCITVAHICTLVVNLLKKDRRIIDEFENAIKQAAETKPVSEIQTMPLTIEQLIKYMFYGESLEMLDINDIDINGKKYTAGEVTQIAKHYVKLHVQAALKAASEKAAIVGQWGGDEFRDVDINCHDQDGGWMLLKVNADEILNAYPLENIK